MALLHAWSKRKMARSQVSGSVLANEAHSALRQKRPAAPWIRALLYRSARILALALAYGLFASFASAQPTLERVDPVVFAALQLSLLLPVGLVILCCTWRASTSRSVQLGLVGGLPLGIGFVCVALSLHALGIIPSAMLTALDGLMASLISWLVFRQPLSLYTCLAAACACGGAVLLWWIAPSHWQPDLVALACGLLFTLYAFHVEHHARTLQFWRACLFPFFGGLFCAMALTALALALCFGRWESLQAMTTTDLGVLLYCGLATVLIPQVIVTLLLRQMSAVTIAFFAVLEPLLSIGFAFLWGELALNILGWCGVSLILLSLLLQAHASRREAQKQPEAPDEQADVQHAVSSSTVG
jgi:drug/metabolite transporter (DMT)-like permease